MKLDELKKKARAHAAAPLLARTHGQPAVGTTFGKEFAVFAARLEKHQVVPLRVFFITPIVCCQR